MALPSALLSLSLLLGTQLTGTAPTHGTSQQSPVPPGPSHSCGPHEYWSAGRCCQLCPAGEHVREPCSRPHTRGQCEKCDRGTFTAFPNGLGSCLLCGTCSEHQDVVAECTATSNRVCWCRPGRFYRAPGNGEFCLRCSRCPQGTMVLQPCNSTADTVCGPPAPESRHRLCLIGSFAVVCLGISIVTACVKKHKDGGLQPGCSGLPSAECSELEPLEDRTLDGGESLGPESSVCSGSSHGTRETDPPGPMTGDHGLSACSLDLMSEARTAPSFPESPAGVGGPQAAAVRRPGGQDDGATELRSLQRLGDDPVTGLCGPPRCGCPPCTRSQSCDLRAQATAKSPQLPR